MQFLISYIPGFILFFLSAYFTLFVPGTLFLSIIKINKSFSQVENQIISWFTGIAIFILISYASSYIQIPKLSELLVILLGIFWIYKIIKIRKTFKPNFNSFDKLSILLIILGSLTFSSIMFFSGLKTPSGLQFFDTNSVDGIRHVAYIRDQIYHFPPQEPGVAGESLKGFHYFYDFLLSRFSLFYSFSVFDLYFRYFPLLISLLYGFSFILFATRMKVNLITQRFLLFLVYFSRSSLVLFLFLIPNLKLTDDAIVQPTGLIINPFLVLSLGFLMTTFFLMPLIKKSAKFGILLGILLGILSQLKIYSGIIGLFCFILYSIYLLIRYKKKYLSSILITTGVTGIITAITFLPNNLGAGGFVFAPFLFFEHYMQIDMFKFLQWENRLLTYQHYHNNLKIYGLYFLAVTTFIVLNTGIRILAFGNIKKIFSINFWRNENNFIVFCSLVITFIIPTFFIQSVSVFDTVQFFWIWLVILCIPTAIVLGAIFKKSSNVFLKYLILVLLIAISFPGISAMIQKFALSKSPIIISSADVITMEEIPLIVSPNSFITLLPTAPNATNNYPFPRSSQYLAAITGRQVYYQRGWLPSPDASKYQIREQRLLKIKSDLLACLPSNIVSGIKEIGSPYIVIVGNYSCFERSFKIVKKIHNNGGLLTFYEVSLK